MTKAAARAAAMLALTVLNLRGDEFLLDRWDVDLSSVQPAKFPLLSTHAEDVARATHPHQLRLEMIARLDGTITSKSGDAPTD